MRLERLNISCPRCSKEEGHPDIEPEPFSKEYSADFRETQFGITSYAWLMCPEKNEPVILQAVYPRTYALSA